MSDVPPLPGGTGLTRVQVYSSRTPDGQCGGCPHMHLVCTELYYTVRGTGAVEFLSYRDGPQRVTLAAGQVVYFTPGVIHRLVNQSADLEILVLMENSGLPELGDAVLTFPPRYLRGPDRYALARAVEDRSAYCAQKAAPATVAEAGAMRDLAVRGYLDLVAAFAASPEQGRARLREFQDAATALVRPLVDRWSAVVAAGPAAALRRTGLALAEVGAGRTDHLHAGAVVEVPRPDLDRPNLSMCGFMWPLLPDGVTFDSLGAAAAGVAAGVAGGAAGLAGVAGGAVGVAGVAGVAAGAGGR
jgi:mannose-6-phosphate isomerase-like protein (cupin superfamily)